MPRTISAGHGGFATATILIVVAIIASTTLWSYREVLTGRTLANARLFQARAAALAGIGLQEAQARLRADPQAAHLVWQQNPSGAQDEQVAITTRLLRTESLPTGFSAGRFVEHQHEITSTATSGLGTRVVQTMGVGVLGADIAGAEAPGCPVAHPVAIRVQIGKADGTAAVTAMLLTGDPGLRIVDAAGQVLWSAAGPDARARQHLFDDQTRISTSVTVLDTDSDGLHDRIYAGDHAGRLWRLDLHNGNDAERFASASVLADLSVSGAERAFLAAPDVSLAIDAAAALAWLNISIGTTGSSGANRLFVLRDYAARQQWSDLEHQRARALREQDLHVGSIAPDVPAPPGYYFDLGDTQVFTPSVTIDGKVTYAAAETTVRAADGCTARVGIGTFRVADGAALRLTAFGDAAAGSPLSVALEGAQHRRIRCSLAGAALPQCSGLDPVRRRWWRREDAD